MEKGEIGENTPSDYYWPIKRFCDRHKRNLPTIDIEWSRLYDIVERKSNHSEDDAPYTVGQIHKLTKNPNRRIKPMALVMCSSGIRLGSWMYMKWKHVTPITNADYLRLKKQEENEKAPDQRNSDIINIPITSDDENKVIAAKLRAYDTKRSRWYNTFITPEAYHALKDWMDFRSNVQHEDINGESWVMIDQKVSFGTTPKKMEYGGAKKMLNRALKKEGIRPKNLPEGKRRYEVKESHGFRKFFDNRAGENGVMHPYNVELLLDHALLGSKASYWKPTPLQLLEDYLRAIPRLTINYDHEKSVLQKQVVELTEENKQQTYVIKKGLAEKEREVEETKKMLEATASELAKLRAKQEEAARRQQIEIDEIKNMITGRKKKNDNNIDATGDGDGENRSTFGYALEFNRRLYQLKEEKAREHLQQEEEEQAQS